MCWSLTFSMMLDDVLGENRRYGFEYIYTIARAALGDVSGQDDTVHVDQVDAIVGSVEVITPAPTEISMNLKPPTGPPKFVSQAKLPGSVNSHVQLPVSGLVQVSASTLSDVTPRSCMSSPCAPREPTVAPCGPQ